MVNVSNATSSALKKILTRKYYNPKLKGSLAGKKAFHRVLIEETPYKQSQVDSWLSSQDTYTLHKPARRIYKRRRVIVHGKDDQYQADLVDVSHLSKYNQGYKYILTCIDVFSKYAWAIPLKNKTGATLIEAFKKIFKQRKPLKLQTDEGREFINQPFQNFLKTHQVHFFVTKSELKACVVECFNRTLKSKMWKYFTAKNTLKYIDILQDLLHSYNHSYHTSIKRSPIEVNVQNEREVYRILYKDMGTFTKFKFKKGDSVRVSKVKRIFEKGYLPNWTEEIFIIAERIRSAPPVYKLKDQNGEIIEGTYYEAELQQVQEKGPEDYHKIEKIIKQEKRGHKTYYLVKWKGYPNTFNSWVTNLKKI